MQDMQNKLLCYITACLFKKGWKLMSFNLYLKDDNDVQYTTSLAKNSIH